MKWFFSCLTKTPPIVNVLKPSTSRVNISKTTYNLIFKHGFLCSHREEKFLTNKSNLYFLDLKEAPIWGPQGFRVELFLRVLKTLLEILGSL